MAEGQIFYTEIIKKEEIHSILTEACFKESKIQIALEDGNQISAFLKKSYCEAIGELEVDLEGIVFIAQKSYKATIFADGQVYGAVLNFKEKNTFNFPLKFFKINRREAYRFKLPENENVILDVFVGNNKYSASLIDISLDGLGCFLPMDIGLKAEALIDKITFTLDGKSILVSGKLMVLIPFTKGTRKGYKLGIKFTQSEFLNKSYIINYINRNVCKKSA